MTRYAWDRRLVARAVGPLLALIVSAALPASASAACGDWLEGVMSRHAGRSLDAPEIPPPAGAAPFRPVRCDGPECDRGPSDRPTVPPAPTVEVLPDQSAWLSRADRNGSDVRSRFGRNDDTGRGRYVPFVPERPPRG